MKLTFLGTGDCGGVPVYGCHCDGCGDARRDPAKERQSCCALISTNNQNILLDAGIIDLGKRFQAPFLSRIFVSHYHIDHMYGLFALRWGSDALLPVHGPDDPEGWSDLRKHPGILDFSDPLYPFASRTFGDLQVTPLPLNHSKHSLGFAFASGTAKLAWLCDTGGLPEQTLSFLLNWRPDVMVLDCTLPPQQPPPAHHNDLSMAMALHKHIGPYRTYCTHISHQLDHWLNHNLPPLADNILFAHDGQTITIANRTSTT